MNTYQDFFRHWDDVHNITVRTIKLFPEEKKNFKPVEQMMTVMQIIKHIATVVPQKCGIRRC